MKINPLISKIDPSRYTVYQTLDYVKRAAGLELTQKKTANLFLFKAQPFVDSLYNYAHVLGGKLTLKDLKTIKEFFGTDKFRIKIPENQDIADLLLTNGFKLKSTGYVMVAKKIKTRDYNYSLPENVKILPADSRKTLKQVKNIFAAAFNCSLADCEKKLGFLDEKILDREDRHLKSFILYENDQPVATGAYYAFDKFSIESIGTLESARGRGYAGLIMKHLLREAQRLGYNSACLSASEAGRSVYEKVGFESLLKTAAYIL
jgi:GNAT superfamily N-acetyltransferase